MRMLFRWRKQTLDGDLVTMRFRILAAGTAPPGSIEEAVLGQHTQADLLAYVEDEVAHRLGGHFYVHEFTVDGGSTELTFVVGATPHVVDRPANVAGRIESLFEQLRRGLGRFFGGVTHGPVVVHGGWEPRRGLDAAGRPSRHLEVLLLALLALLVVGVAFSLLSHRTAEGKVLGYRLLVPGGSFQAMVMPWSWWDEDAAFGSWMECQLAKQNMRKQAEVNLERLRGDMEKVSAQGQSVEALAALGRLDALTRARDRARWADCRAVWENAL